MDDQRATASSRGRSKTVRQLMRPAVTTVEEHAHLAAAAYTMMHAGDTAVVVTTGDEAALPIGIITQTDITKAVADGKDLNESRIEEMGRPAPVTVDAATTVNEATEIMLTAGVRHLPVIDGGRLVGIVDITDVCRALLDETRF
jgi:CBS domain-containing protein